MLGHLDTKQHTVLYFVSLLVTLSLGDKAWPEEAMNKAEEYAQICSGGGRAFSTFIGRWT